MLRKNENNAWTDITQLRRHDGSAWVDCNFARKYENSAWQNVYPSVLYLIKNGTYSVNFTIVNCWSYWSYNPDGHVNFGNGYVELYSPYEDMISLYTTNPIDFSKYTKINISADINVYADNSTYYNEAYAGIYPSIPSATRTGNPANFTSDLMWLYTMHDSRVENSRDSSTFYPIELSMDVSSVVSSGHLFLDVTCWNWPGEYSRLRIKNLWLS